MYRARQKKQGEVVWRQHLSIYIGKCGDVKGRGRQKEPSGWAREASAGNRHLSGVARRRVVSHWEFPTCMEAA